MIFLFAKIQQKHEESKEILSKILINILHAYIKLPEIPLNTGYLAF